MSPPSSPDGIRPRNDGRRYRGKVALVTGATGGIGQAIARRLDDEGAELMLSGRSLQRAEPLLETLSGQARFQAVELGDEDGPQRLVEAAIEAFGRLDVLVNNAGLDHADDLLNATRAEARRIFEINFFAALAMLQCAAREMSRADGGAIVNVTSRLAVIGVPTMGIYGASKGALLALTKAAAIELATKGIRVNAVAPGFTRTPLYEAWLKQQSDPRAAEEEAVVAIPQRRLAAPDDVAQAVAFLGSDEAGHITGASLAVDGGYTAG